MLRHACSGRLYELLQVSPDSGADEITRQYRALALRCHPDRTGGTTTEEFKEIEEAHRILSDPTQRRLYDILGREQMKLIGGSGVFNVLLAKMAIRTVLALLIFVTSMVLITFVLAAIRLDANKGWSWGLVMLPLWLLSPFFLLIAIGILMMAVRLRAFIFLMLGLEMVMMVVIAITSTLALAGSLTPPSRAFISWTVWYLLMSLRCLYGLIPRIYVERMKELSDPFRNMSDSEATAFHRGAYGGTDSSFPIQRAASPSATWSWWKYGVDVARELWELLCVLSFMCLAYVRAAQGPVDANSSETNRVDGVFLSFWIVFAPLIAYFGVLVLLQMISACLWPQVHLNKNSSSHHNTSHTNDGLPINTQACPQDEDSSAHPKFKDHPSCGSAVDASLPSGASLTPLVFHVPPPGDKPHSTCGVCFLSVACAVAWPGSWLYMTCMWASKMEWEYNYRASSALLHPSVFVASIPFFASLVLLMLTLCCIYCCLGSIMDEAAGVVNENVHEQQPASSTMMDGSVGARTCGGGFPNAQNYHRTKQQTGADRGHHCDAAVSVAFDCPGTNANTSLLRSIEGID